MKNLILHYGSPAPTGLIISILQMLLPRHHRRPKPLSRLRGHALPLPGAVWLRCPGPCSRDGTVWGAEAAPHNPSGDGELGLAWPS